MDNILRSRCTRALMFLLCSPAMISALSACQSYKRAPLDLASHNAALNTRLVATDPIVQFLERLDKGSPGTPDRFDLADGLSLAEAEVLALFYNPDLRLARLDAGVARATFETAGLWEDPQFGFDGAEILSRTSPFEYGLTLSLTIPVSGRLGVEKDRAGSAYEAELRRIIDAEWSTRARVRSQWAVWSAASERLRLLNEVIEQTARIAEITDRLQAAGELTRVEARLLRAALVKARSDVAQAEFKETRARVTLHGLLGLLPAASVELVQMLPSPTSAPTVNVLDRLVESNTLLAVRRAEYLFAEESLRLEVQKQYPDITIGSGFGSEGGDDRLLLGVSLPIPILNGNRGGIAEARAERDVARAAAETTFERLAGELALAQASLDAARSQRNAFERELVPMLDEQSDEVERLVELGEVNTLLLLETVTGRFEAKSRLLDLRLAEVSAAIQIEHLLGPREPAVPAPVQPSNDHEHTGTTNSDATRATTSEEETG